MSQTSRVVSTNHTSFTVADIDRVIGFFRDALGLKADILSPATTRVMTGVTGVDNAQVRLGIVMCPNNHMVELFQYVVPNERHTMKPRPCDPGFAHIAFEVDDIPAVIAEGERYGFRPVREPIWVDMTTLDVIDPRVPPTGRPMLNCYLRDPDGLTVELMQY